VTLATLTPRDLTGAQTQLISKDPRPGTGEDRGTLIEELFADVLGPNWKHRPDRAEWYDVVNEQTGTKLEAKSCLLAVGEKYPAKGRFRLRRDQTRSLTASDANGTAWYGFGLVDLDGGRIYLRRAKPSTVTQWVTDRGGWNTANHGQFDYQHKLPYDVPFPEANR